jgi:hypothetical protein
MQQFLEY